MRKWARKTNGGNNEPEKQLRVMAFGWDETRPEEGEKGQLENERRSRQMTRVNGQIDANKMLFAKREREREKAIGERLNATFREMRILVR